ncbi:MAG: hypothetical protein M3N29_09470 [Chloroflexota bacterium]|nr:hypothetical protein [Chloroflexota bacterium]
MDDAQRDRLPRETPLNPPAPNLDELPRQLTGDQAEGDQVAYRREDEVEHEATETSWTEIYQGELEASGAEAIDEPVQGLGSTELREGETDDPNVAAEEGLTWVPPIDPPVVPDEDDREDLSMAAGFGVSAIDEPYDAEHSSAPLASEDEMSALVRDALRADAATSRYADEIAIGTIGRSVALRGVVDDIDDSDNLVEVAGRVVGIDNVIDELEVRALQ